MLALRTRIWVSVPMSTSPMPSSTSAKVINRWSNLVELPDQGQG